MGGELGVGVGIGWWGSEYKIWQFVELDEIVWIPSVETEAGLAAVGGGAKEVDGNVVGGEEAGEVEKLVEMALCDEGHHNHHHF